MYLRAAYVSRAAPGIGARDAYDIIRTAHNRNAASDLSGCLLLVDGHFAQVLEGQDSRVRERLAAIARDPRHTGMQIRSECLAAERLFEGQWMALCLPEQIPEALRVRHGYAPGFPRATFDGEQLVRFVLACCRAAAADTV